MRGYFGLGQLSAAEKSDILNQHKSLYNGYQTLQPQVSNTQPLHVYDFAGDKEGLVVNNKGEVKKYSNMGINEQTEAKEVCDECGAMIMDGMCTECNYGHMEEETGKLEDIYNVEDLNPNSGFDYIEGSSNDTDTFEGMHKDLYKEDESDFMDYESSYTEDGVDDTDNEDDGFEDINTSEISDELEEQGGNADDMDVDDVTPAYDFESNGPMDGGDVYPVNELDEDDMYGYEPEKTYEQMESAWADDEIEEQDVSGVQGIYGAMKKAYDFDSDGPGKAGPYQEFSYESEDKGDEDYEEDELRVDFDKFDPRDKSWEEIKAHTGDEDWSEIDEDLQESFITQKNKITEMFNRISRFN